MAERTGRPCKTPGSSRSEIIRGIKSEDINPNLRLFGGRLMSWMDEIAGLTAMRHAGTSVTTAAVDNLQFLKPVMMGDIIVMIARVTYVGGTSLEVRVDVYKEELGTGSREEINRAYFTEVCIDEEGRPARVPYDIVPETDAERTEMHAARKRIEMRRIRRQQGF